MDDNKLKKLLKEQSYKPGKNEWFTPRVLNKLPARQYSTKWATLLVNVVAVIACIVAWVLLLKHSDFMVITVRDIMYCTSLLGVSSLVAWQVLKGLVLSDE